LQGRQIKVEIDADWIVETTPARKSVHGVDSLEGRSRRRG
jgi:hypothetical protein